MSGNGKSATASDRAPRELTPERVGLRAKFLMHIHRKGWEVTVEGHSLDTVALEVLADMESFGAGISAELAECRPTIIQIAQRHLVLKLQKLLVTYDQFEGEARSVNRDEYRKLLEDTIAVSRKVGVSGGELMEVRQSMVRFGLD